MRRIPARKYSIKKQEKIFSQFWDKFSKQIASNQGVVDFPGRQDMPPHHITTVIRLPLNISKKLHEAFSDVLPLDYHYPAEDMHLTLINLDKLLGDKKDIDWQELGSRISKEIRELSQPQFRIKGAGFFPTTVFAQIYDMNSTLELYRAAIIKGVSAYLSKEIDIATITALVPGIAFTNLIRFTNRPDPSLITSIESKRKVEFGSFQPSKFELVTTNKLLSKDSTITNAVIELL